MTPDLLEFTRRALEKGNSRDVADALRAAGWSDQEVASALSAYALVAFGLAVPAPSSPPPSSPA